MMNLRWLHAIPVVLGATLVAASAQGATVRDRAGMFSKDVVQKAQARLERLQRATGIPIVIETIEAIPGIDQDASKAERRQAIESLAKRRDQAIDTEGIYLLMSRDDHVISTVLVRKRYAALLPIEKRDAIIDALTEGFKKKDYDGGLTRAVETIEQSLEGASGGKHAARVPVVLGAPVQHRVAGERAAAGPSMFWTFILIIAGIFGVLFVLRLIGGLMGRSSGAGYPGRAGMGMPGPGMGGAPGYGGYGYGGRGGGFFSGMLGGLGGALAGNWLYDQFSGRHGHVTSADAASAADYTSGTPDQGGDAIVGADDNPGGGTSWDDGGAADTGGGDWGGGGGDWGGGDGGGDWGGGGGGDW
jgi:uncharacterized membrane protein YgcG